MIRVLLAAMAIGWSGGEPTVKFSPRHELGEAASYRFKADVQVSTENAADAAGRAKFRLQSDATIRFRVIGVDDDGAATISGVFERFSASVVGEGRDSRVELADENPEDDQNVKAEGDGAAARVATAVMAAALRIDVGADGRVLNMTGLEEAYAAAEGFGREGAQVLGLFAPESARRTIGYLGMVDEPGEDGAFRERAAGDEWTVERTTPMGVLGRMATKVRYHLTGFGAKGGSSGSGLIFATLTGEGTSEIVAPPGETDLTRPRGRIDEQNERHQVTWSLPHSRLSRRQIELSITTTTWLSEALISTATAKGTIEVSRVEPR